MENDESTVDFKRFAAESLRELFWRPKSRHNRFSDVGSRLFVVPSCVQAFSPLQGSATGEEDR